ncbi:CRTAC1 family protein [Micromonospora olivasterospora]
MFLVARPDGVSAETRRDIAGGYRFTPMSVQLPGGYPQQTIRKVNRAYAHLAGWISSVGAGIAMNDLDGDGLANDLCLTDVRIDRVVVAPTPGARADRYASFALDPAPLPMNPHIAPMGCQPGDFNGDGRTDLLVYWWGRTPVLFLRRAEATALSAAAYAPVELVPTAAAGEYRGPKWNTNSVTVADFDGDGHDDIFVGNYFPDGPVLDHTVHGGVTMNKSMSNAGNGGTNHVFRHAGGTVGGIPVFTEERGVFSERVAHGWTLAAAANDVDGDLLPELYVANDFGPDHLLHNRSQPGHIRFGLVRGTTNRATVPKSKVLGHDSFKGMGVDFGDLDGDGLYDMYVGNITTSFGIEESNFAFVNAARDQADLRKQLSAGRAPWEDRSAKLNLAWSGWSWDVKIADFTNRGRPDIVQTAGFVKGDVNRWAQLQELAAANDILLDDMRWWPNVRQGDDIAGGQHPAFHARTPDGGYVDVSAELGLDIPVPTRGIAVGDADGDGRLDMALARQWDAPVFYRNDSPGTGAFLGLRLTRPAAGPGALPAAAIGAQVRATTPDGRVLIGHVDGGNGHSGKRSPEVVLGLGAHTGPVDVTVSWRDRDGSTHQQQLRLQPGWHSVELGAQAREVTR